MEDRAHSTNSKALYGVKVLDWSQLVAGPYCAKLLADLGAEVIKIEKPVFGDEARHRGPFVHGKQHPEKSLLFLYTNTNKLGVTLDIENPEGREKFIELARWADILIEDNHPKVLEELNLTYRDLSQLNPGLVMISITPFGQTGPYRDFKAYPLNTYHGGGLGYLSPLGSGIETPLKMGGFFSEYACGLTSACGTLDALYHQRATGEGQQVDVSKQEAILSLVRVHLALYPNEGIIPSRFGTNARVRDDLPVIRCHDGYIIYSPVQPHQKRALLRMIADPSTEGNEEEYLDEVALERVWKEIAPRVTEWAMSRTKEEIYHRGQALSIPVTPVMTAEDIVKSPQSTFRQFFVEADHPVAGRLTYPAAAYRFSVTPTSIDWTAPLLGQHNEEVFSRRLKSGPTILPRVVSRRNRRGSLEGIRIADFSWAWAGSHATELLAFMGAEVIKIESMVRIDFTRKVSLSTGQHFTGVNESGVFNDLNLNKKSIRLNLTHPRAIELAKKLVDSSDVVAQNMRPGVMEKLGLGYESLKAVKTDIIYLSSSLRGATGPERSYVGYASNFAALGGIAHITGTADALPVRLYGEIDLLSALTSTFTVLAALNHRLQTGKGQHIDLSSAESISALIGDVIMDYLANGVVHMRRGNQDDCMAPHNCYHCKGEDKWISIAVATDEEWVALCQVMGNPEWVRESRFLTAASRWQNQEEMDEMIEQWTRNYNNYQAMELLQAAGVAAVPCFNAEELYKNPHLNYRRCWAQVVHPVMGKRTVLNPQWKISATPAVVTSAAPLLGQHSREVFAGLLGLSDDEISRLEEERVIY